MFRGAWTKVKGRTGVVEAELGTEGNPSAAEGKLPIEALRLRCDSLLYMAYDACRRALSYLRWHEDDANDFTPSLSGPAAHARRTTRRRRTRRGRTSPSGRALRSGGHSPARERRRGAPGRRRGR